MTKRVNFSHKTLIVRLILGVVLLSCAICFYSCAIITGFITGFESYNNETISDIIPYYRNIYVITEDGYCYVSGDYSSSSSNKYWLYESTHNDKLYTHTPVKILDERVKKVIPYSTLGALLIDEDDRLFDFNDFTVKEVYNGVSYATIVPYYHNERIFGNGNTYAYYVIDKSGVLYAVSESGETKKLFSQVCSVDFYLDTILVLNDSGVLNQYQISESGEITLTEKLFENVSSFDVMDTSLRFDGEKYVFDDEAAKDLPLINVLTNDGELYTKGAYNLLCCTLSLAAHPEPKIIDEWTLIAEKVEDFSMAPMGTAIKFTNSSAGYYGFDTDNSANSKFEFGYLELAPANVIDVYASDVQVLVKTTQAFYKWGSSLEYDVEGDHTLFTGSPIILYP